MPQKVIMREIRLGSAVLANTVQGVGVGGMIQRAGFHTGVVDSTIL